MKGTKNLSKKSAIPASIPKKNQRRIKKCTRLSAEGINERRLCTILKNLCQRNFVLYIGCFICVIDVVLEFCIISDSFKDEMCIIDPRQSLRKESMWLYREKMEKRLFKEGGKGEKGGRCYVCVPTFIQVDPSG